MMTLLAPNKKISNIVNISVVCANFFNRQQNNVIDVKKTFVTIAIITTATFYWYKWES